jgi:hypothetical protein
MRRWFALSALLLAGCVTSQNQTRTLVGSTPDMRIRDGQLNTVVSAQKAVDGLDERRKNGEALTPLFLEMQYTWSKRLAEAELEAAGSDGQRLAAVQQHLERMQASQDELQRIVNDANIPIALARAQADFYVAEAKQWLARLEKK